MTCLQETVPAIWDCKNICFNLGPVFQNLPPVYAGFLKCRSIFARLVINPTPLPLLTPFRWLQLCIALNVKYSTFKYLLHFIHAHELHLEMFAVSKHSLPCNSRMRFPSCTCKHYNFTYEITSSQYHFTLQNNTNGWWNI